MFVCSCLCAFPVGVCSAPLQIPIKAKYLCIFFVPVNEIKSLFASLKTDLQLDENLGTPYVFIVDKDLNLRGRTQDEDEGTKYGFNSNSVADLNNKMEDDVKIILAEYRLALKKNNADRAH